MKRTLVNTGKLVALALSIGKCLPAHGAPLFSTLCARLVTTLKPPLYDVVRANLRHVLGEAVSSATLHQTVYQLFYNTGQRYYEVFYNLGRGIARATDFRPPVIVPPASQVHLEQALRMGRGVFILACHISNFDLGGIALAQSLPVPLQVLSLADPTPDMVAFNRLRARYGLRMTPISPSALREALEHLQNGGAVVTGPDYPIAAEEPALFFGAPARLPQGYVRIPLRAHSPVVVSALRYEEGVYKVLVNPPFMLTYTGNREQDDKVNVRRILEQVEAFIRQRPAEWMMYKPVWEDNHAHLGD